MGSGFSKMKKQARLMQEQYSQIKNNLETTLVEGSAGNGLVTVTLNGARELKKIVIKPECAGDVEGLQDLILGAFQNASSKIDIKNNHFTS
ncbi:MAG TPA: YbaB/EbfC family nucleoid-associated protein [Chlamydiales bacterium]|nr:YbaB/EbfC family nucleoid-associated protein [Chlamydiales bacterium]